MKTQVTLVFCLLTVVGLSAQPSEMKTVGGGAYLPLYGSATLDNVHLHTFYLEATPVTHAQYLAFVAQAPQWKRSAVIRLYADANYLGAWTADTSVPAHLLNSPVNNVSWFAAKAYCQHHGRRLPTVDEWEYASMADATRPDARLDSLYSISVLRGYEKPKTHLLAVGEDKANYYGIHNLHGMVWEWTHDFNSIIITGESRGGGETDRGLFCASGAIGANDLMNYASFMRYAFRASLKANYTVTNLGFRCASDFPEVKVVQTRESAETTQKM